MKKSQLRKIIRENIRYIMSNKRLNEQFIPGSQEEIDWQNDFDQLIFNAANPCRFLCIKLNKLSEKISKLGGGTGIASSAAGQVHAAMMVAKILYIQFMLDFFCDTYGVEECCECEVNITEGKGTSILPKWALALLTPSQIARIKASAEKSAEKIAQKNGYKRGGNGGGGIMNEQGQVFDFNEWKAKQQTILLGNPFNSNSNGHQNPCNYLNKKIQIINNKLGAQGGGTGIPNTAAGDIHSAQMTQKYNWWSSQLPIHNC